MIDAITYSDIVNAVDKDIKGSPKRVMILDSVDPATENIMAEINSKIKKHTLVAILFCNPQTQFCKTEILESLSYFHHRSKQHINIFCCGYGAYWPEQKYPDLKVVTEIDGVDWSYSDSSFVVAVEDFEKRTKWKYSGENELLLLDVCSSSVNNELNIKNAIVCNLEKMKKDNAFSSVRALFEDIIRYAASNEAADAWQFSDTKGGDIAKDLLKNTILGFLPGKLQDTYNKAESYAIKKI